MLKQKKYEKLEIIHANNLMNYIPKLKETFPELNEISDEDLYDRFIALKIQFYKTKEVPVNNLIRLTLPFAAILSILMLVSLPFVFILTGNWYYTNTNTTNAFILNWFRQLFNSY